MDHLLQIVGLLLSSTILGTIFTYATSRRQRNNDFIGQLQQSIDLLSDKNEDLMRRVVELREQNIELLANQEEMRMELEQLRRLYERETGKPAPSPTKKRKPKDYDTAHTAI